MTILVDTMTIVFLATNGRENDGVWRERVMDKKEFEELLESVKQAGGMRRAWEIRRCVHCGGLNHDWCAKHGREPRCPCECYEGRKG